MNTDLFGEAEKRFYEPQEVPPILHVTSSDRDGCFPQAKLRASKKQLKKKHFSVAIFEKIFRVRLMQVAFQPSRTIKK